MNEHEYAILMRKIADAAREYNAAAFARGCMDLLTDRRHVAACAGRLIALYRLANDFELTFRDIDAAMHLQGVDIGRAVFSAAGDARRLTRELVGA